MDRQTAFDRVVSHLSTMKERSCSSVHGCAYRGDNQSKCAIGILIPDEEYNPNFEGLSIMELGDKIPSLQNLGDRFLDQLQCAHDDPFLWDDGKFIGWCRLMYIANDYDLSATQIYERLNETIS